jgi:dihydrodipicolinate reductase
MAEMMHLMHFLLLHLFQVNGCTGKMGMAVIKAADSAGVNVVPVSFGSAEESGQTLQVHGKDIVVHGPADRENVLASVFNEHPNLIVVDYTVPSAVNGIELRNILFGNKEKTENKTITWTP